MINKLKTIINCNFEVVDQVAGIRPTTRDRRPFLGTLLDCENKVFFNGLGTRGITSAPSLAKSLYDYIENDLELPKEMDIKRYYKW
jgi:glycine/D-amino acid oxidase-like deaminating enzyme